MKKILIVLVIFVFGFLISPEVNQVFAASCSNLSATGLTSIVSYPETQTHVITINMSGWDPNYEYNLQVKDGSNTRATSRKFAIDFDSPELCYVGGDCVSVTNNIVTWTIDSKGALSFVPGDGNSTKYEVFLNAPLTFPGPNQCSIGRYEVKNEDNVGGGCSIKVSQERDSQICYQNEAQNACFEYGLYNPIKIEVSNLTNIAGTPWEKLVRLVINGDDTIQEKAVNGTVNFLFNSDNKEKDYTLLFEGRTGLTVSSYKRFPGCAVKVSTQKDCAVDDCEEETIIIKGPNSLGPDVFSLCSQIPEDQGQQRLDCFACTGGDTTENEENAGVWTAIGCINRDPQAIIEKLIKVGLGIGGGIALITFLAAGFIFSTSQGSPEKVKSAKEMMTASVVGILFVIFSVTLLQFIGWSVLKIPGFGG